MAKKSDDSKLDTILGLTGDIRIDVGVLKSNMETMNANTTQLFLKADDHGQRIAKVEVKVDDAQGDLKTHVADRLIHNGSSSHLPSQGNGGWSTKQKTVAAIGGGSIGIGGSLYGLIELLKHAFGAN